MGDRGQVHVDAVVSDLVLDLGGDPPDPKQLERFRPRGKEHRNLLRQVLIACWLLHDEPFRQARRFARPALAWLTDGLSSLARLVAADLLVSDPDRREELARLCLAALGLRPLGESQAQAEDRLKTLNSVERERILRETQAQVEHARRLRQAMQEQQAREAAARYSRE